MTNPQVIEHFSERCHSNLERYVAAAVTGIERSIGFAEFEAGASSRTYRVGHSAGSYALRMRPLGVLTRGAHAIDRERKVLSALSTGNFPTPTPALHCGGASVIETDFYLIPGRLFDDSSLPTLVKGERGAVYDSLNETIARLRSFDPDELGLGRHPLRDRLQLVSGPKHETDVDRNLPQCRNGQLAWATCQDVDRRGAIAAVRGSPAHAHISA